MTCRYGVEVRRTSFVYSPTPPPVCLLVVVSFPCLVVVPNAGGQFTDQSRLLDAFIVLICGTTDFGNAGRKTVPKNDTPSTYPDLSSVHIVRALSNIRVSKIRTSHSSSHVVFLSVEGNAFVMGRNEHGQLGFKPERPTSNGKAGKTTGDLYTGAAIHSPAKLRRQDFQPALPPGKDGDIVEAATGRHHTLLITRSGQVYCAGLGTQGQVRFSLCLVWWWKRRGYTLADSLLSCIGGCSWDAQWLRTYILLPELTRLPLSSNAIPSFKPRPELTFLSC